MYLQPFRPGLSSWAYLRLTVALAASQASSNERTGQTFSAHSLLPASTAITWIADTSGRYQVQSQFISYSIWQIPRWWCSFMLNLQGQFYAVYAALHAGVGCRSMFFCCECCYFSLCVVEGTMFLLVTGGHIVLAGHAQQSSKPDCRRPMAPFHVVAGTEAAQCVWLACWPQPGSLEGVVGACIQDQRSTLLPAGSRR
jgi:hypothetical protein